MPYLNTWLITVYFNTYCKIFQAMLLLYAYIALHNLINMIMNGKDLSLGAAAYLGTLLATKIGAKTFLGHTIINGVGMTLPSQVGGVIAQASPLLKTAAVAALANPATLPIAACVATFAVCVKYGESAAPEDPDEFDSYFNAHMP